MQKTPVSRVSVAEVAQGLVTETFPRHANASNQAPSSGDLVASMVGLLEGDVVTDVYVIVGTAASGLTLAKVGIYDLNGYLLASSADISASLGTQGMKQLALSAPFHATRQDGYYVGLLQVGTTPAAIRRANSSTFDSSACGTGFRPNGVQSGQTDLPNPATFGNLGPFYWFGVG